MSETINISNSFLEPLMTSWLQSLKKSQNEKTRKSFLKNLILNEFLTKIYDTNPSNNDEMTPLHFAAKNGDKQICKIIMDVTEDIYPKTNKGISPLQLAAQNGHKKIGELFF